MQITVKALPSGKQANSSLKKSDCLVLLGNNKDLKSLSNELTEELAQQARHFYNSDDFKNAAGNSHMFYHNKGVKRLLVVNSGKGETKSAAICARKIYGQLKSLQQGSATLILGDSLKAEFVAQLTQNLATAAYVYDTTKKQGKTSKLKLSCQSASKEMVKAGKQGLVTGQSMNVTRQLGNLPGNICTPDYLAKQARLFARKHDKLKITVLNEKHLTEQGFGSFMSVAKGSDQKPRLIAMEYAGGKKSSKPYVLVGKGITFDSGGISLKPGAQMDEMKYDMCGAATVFGVMNAVAELKLPINVVGVVAAAENMPSGGASKPGDVVTSLSGKTIEILNTDAEGRLVLCDTLTWVARYKPETVIDIATLTGACIIALGHHKSGLLSNDDKLAQELLKAGEVANDTAWQLPLGDEYSKQLKSNFADLANIGGRSAGTITAGAFLAAFTEDYRWAHLDIAGTAWVSGGNKGATGRPVPLLLNYLLANC